MSKLLIFYLLCFTYQSIKIRYILIILKDAGFLRGLHLSHIGKRTYILLSKNFFIPSLRPPLKLFVVSL